MSWRRTRSLFEGRYKSTSFPRSVRGCYSTPSPASGERRLVHYLTRPSNGKVSGCSCLGSNNVSTADTDRLRPLFAYNPFARHSKDSGAPRGLVRRIPLVCTCSSRVIHAHAYVLFFSSVVWCQGYTLTDSTMNTIAPQVARSCTGVDRHSRPAQIQ